MPRETHFREEWLLQLDSNNHVMSLWCTRGRKETEAFCSLCNVYFSCANRGKDHLVKHSDTKKHIAKANIAYSTNQSKLIINKGGVVEKSSSKNTDTSSNDPARAEILWAFKVVDSNFSFASCEGLKDLFVAMFGEAAKNFSMNRTKVSYLISYGLGPFITNELTSTIRNSAVKFALCVDETTTAQVKKQLDLYVRFWGPDMLKPVQCRYLSSAFLGHAEAETMFQEICNQLEMHGLNLSKLIMLAMDGPNVNKSLWNKMNSAVKYFGSPGLINIGSCNLHIVHNAFGSGLKEAPFHQIEDYAHNVYKWFKQSAARRQDYKHSQELLAVSENYFLQFVNSRWLTLAPVMKRLIEQHEALKHYFLKFIPKYQNSVCVKNARYNSIISVLNDKLILSLMQFLVHISELFSKFLRTFQNEQPLIHILYDELCELLKKILRKFVKSDVVNQSLNDLTGIKFTTENLLPFHKMEIGTEAKRTSSQMSDRDNLEFNLAVQCFYKKVTAKLFTTLPLKNSILKNLQCLHGLMRSEDTSYNSFKRLVTQVPHGLDDCDRDNVLDEWRSYQVDDEIKEHWFIKDKNKEEIKYHRIDYYWAKVFNIKSLEGKCRYPVLAKYIPNLLMLAHGNSDVERGFSLNNALVTSERNALAENTIKGVRAVKDYLRIQGKIENILITKKMIEAARASSGKYKAALEKNKHVDQQKTKASNKTQVRKEQNLDRKNSLKEKTAAQKLLEEGKAKLHEALKRKDFSNASLASDMIEISTKRLKKIDDELTKK